MTKLTELGDPTANNKNDDREADIDDDDDDTSNSSPQAKRISSSILTWGTDGALNAHIKRYTGTENDLRSLTMEQMAQLLKSYGFKDNDIARLRRWDRVHVIRDVSTRHLGHDGLVPRFARGKKMKLSDQKKIDTVNNKNDDREAEMDDDDEDDTSNSSPQAKSTSSSSSSTKNKPVTTADAMLDGVKKNS